MQSDWAETGNKPEKVGSNSLSLIRERRLSSLRSASSSWESTICSMSKLSSF